MIGGNVQEFVDTLSLGIEKEFRFKGRTLFAQGGKENETWEMTVAQWDPPKDEYLWSTKASSMKECFDQFLRAPLFDGQTFWQAEHEIEWVAG